MTFSIGSFSASAYCGLSAADLARANSYYSYGGSSNCDTGYCSDCGSYGSVSNGSCGDCNGDDCGECYDCATGGDCSNDDCGVCYDCVTGGDCSADDGCGECYDCVTGGDCSTDDGYSGNCDEKTVNETPKAAAPTAPVQNNTAPSYDLNSLLKSILSRLFTNSDYSYITIPSATETTPAAEPKPVVTEPKVPVVTVPDSDCADYAVEMLAMINDARAEVGAPALKLSSELCNAANIRAKEIATSFSHTRPSGDSFYSVLDDIGYSGSRSSGENIAAGNSSVSATFKQWMQSQGHYENMMKADYKYVGIGFYKTSSGYKYHWTQIFSY
jgi:uncharacterized protein YkwD